MSIAAAPARAAPLWLKLASARAGIDARRRWLDPHHGELRLHLLEVAVVGTLSTVTSSVAGPAYQRDATAVAEPTSEVAADTKADAARVARAIVAPICWLVACVR